MHDRDKAALLINVVMDFYRCENARDWVGVGIRVSPDIMSQSYPSGTMIC